MRGGRHLGEEAHGDNSYVTWCRPGELGNTAGREETWEFPDSRRLQLLNTRLPACTYVINAEVNVDSAGRDGIRLFGRRLGILPTFGNLRSTTSSPPPRPVKLINHGHIRSPCSLP